MAAQEPGGVIRPRPYSGPELLDPERTEDERRGEPSIDPVHGCAGVFLIGLLALAATVFLALEVMRGLV